jgi:hypothetical protein
MELEGIIAPNKPSMIGANFNAGQLTFGVSSLRDDKVKG